MASSMEEAREKMRKMRESNARKSEEVLELWEGTLMHYATNLGSELWVVYEQVCIAACDCMRLDTAELCLHALHKQFPNSQRVRRLRGLILEADEEFEKATELYDEILEEDETNSVVRKRKVAILKAQDKIPSAIKELTKYLEEFMSDYEAWMELCDLYISEQDYGKAGFCMEELILSNPHNYLYHQKYAEIKYTEDHMEEARRYFAQSLKLNPNNIRSLFGLFLAASNLGASSKAKVKQDNLKYAAWAGEQIAEKYKEVNRGEQPGQVTTVENMLDNLQLLPTP